MGHDDHLAACQDFDPGAGNHFFQFVQLAAETDVTADGFLVVVEFVSEFSQDGDVFTVGFQ